MAEPGRAQETAPSAVGRFLTFRMDRRLFALPAEEVAEVIRMPEVARIPLGPRSLLGVANLRGAVLPVASLRGLLGQATQATTSASRALVLDGAAPVVLTVDSIGSLVSVELARIETDRIELAAEHGERLRGAFSTDGPDREVARILDLKSLLAEAFSPRPRAERHGRAGLSGALAHGRMAARDDGERLVTFEVAGQAFALALDCVREIVSAPADLAVAPHAETLVLGVAPYRDGLLPLLSLRGLLGFARAAAGPSEKVIVTRIGGVLVGLVADRMRTVITADPDLVEPVPAVLAARAGGETRISAIYRGEGGRRLISILSPEQLFREDVMARLRTRRDSGGDLSAQAEGERIEDRRFLVFRLGPDEFGLPIEAVDEVAEAPAQVTRLPRTPDFLEGVVNRRGEVLPVVDQRRRFDMPPLGHGARRRLIVVRTERLRAGLLVDSVSEVLAAPAAAIEPAPDLTGHDVRLVQGVLNLEQTGRLILLLDPKELLSRTERGLLAAFQGEAQAAAPDVGQEAGPEAGREADL
jgi:purine-binding chemotaxis protein CheW